MPFANEHACRVKPPSQFTTFRRENNWQRVDGKGLDVIWGIKDGTSTIQAYRYRLSENWTSSQARSHCSSHNGILFEPATNSRNSSQDNQQQNNQQEEECEECGNQTVPIQGGSMTLKDHPLLRLPNEEEAVREQELEQLYSYKHGTEDAPELYRFTDSGPVTLANDENDGTMEFVASEESPDRHGDIIRVGGWKLGEFRRNPVFLWAHDMRSPSLGRVPNIGPSDNGKQLLARVQWDTEDPFAATIQNKYKKRFLRAVSVGFRPLKFSEADNGGIDFEEQELLELSAVPVPAHPRALRKAFMVTMPDLNPELVKALEEFKTELRGEVKDIEGRVAVLETAPPPTGTLPDPDPDSDPEPEPEPEPVPAVTLDLDEEALSSFRELVTRTRT